MKLIYLKSALKWDSFDVAIYIKIQFFRVLATIEPDRSLLQFVTTNCLIRLYTDSLTGVSVNLWLPKETNEAFNGSVHFINRCELKEQTGIANGSKRKCFWRKSSG